MHIVLTSPPRLSCMRLADTLAVTLASDLLLRTITRT